MIARRVSVLTVSGCAKARDTVDFETPASRATSSIPATVSLPCRQLHHYGGRSHGCQIQPGAIGGDPSEAHLATVRLVDNAANEAVKADRAERLRACGEHDCDPPCIHFVLE